MANYTTSCTANGGILNGSMVLDTSTGDVTSYTSTSQGTGTVRNNNPNSTSLNFNVKFGTNPRVYPVVAAPDGNGGWRGTGGAPSPGAEVETWTATATEAEVPKA